MQMLFREETMIKIESMLCLDKSRVFGKPILLFEFSDTGPTRQAEFFVGFVLTDDELNANRAAWRESLNID